MSKLKEITIFDPRENGQKTYKDRYPELSRTEEYKGLSNKELMMVWWYSNPTSPLVRGDYNDYEKIEKSLEYVDPENKITKNRKKEYKELNFSSAFLRAAERMSKVDIYSREAGLDMLQNFMESFSSISKLKPDDFKNHKDEVDYEKYARTASTITAQLPQILKMSEEGFGVTKKVDSIEEESLIEKHHENKQS
jgi:hypothetical protein